MAAAKRSHCRICFAILMPLFTLSNRYFPPMMLARIQIAVKANSERHQTKSARMRRVPSRNLATRRKENTTMMMFSRSRM